MHRPKYGLLLIDQFTILCQFTNTIAFDNYYTADKYGYITFISNSSEEQVKIYVMTNKKVILSAQYLTG